MVSSQTRVLCCSFEWAWLLTLWAWGLIVGNFSSVFGFCLLLGLVGGHDGSLKYCLFSCDICFSIILDSSSWNWLLMKLHNNYILIRHFLHLKRRVPMIGGLITLRHFHIRIKTCIFAYVFLVLTTLFWVASPRVLIARGSLRWGYPIFFRDFHFYLRVAILGSVRLQDRCLSVLLWCLTKNIALVPPEITQIRYHNGRSLSRTECHINNI